MANFTRYRSGVQRVDDVLGTIQKDIEALETSAATFTTETVVDTLVSTLVSTLFGTSTYTAATMNTAPTDGSVRTVRVSDGGFLGTGGIAIFINGHWVDAASGTEYT